MEDLAKKAILYEITPSFDLLDEKDNHKFLGRLKQRYDRPGIKSIFYDVDPTERYKMLSGMYRHNSSFLQNLVVYFFKISTDNAVRGFRAINQTMDTMKVRKDYIAYDSKDGFVYDSLKLHYINKFIGKTENMNLFFVMSPMWYPQDTLVLAPIKAICKERSDDLLILTPFKHLSCKKINNGNRKHIAGNGYKIAQRKTKLFSFLNKPDRVWNSSSQFYKRYHGDKKNQNVMS